MMRILWTLRQPSLSSRAIGSPNLIDHLAVRRQQRCSQSLDGLESNQDTHTPSYSDEVWALGSVTPR